MFLSSNQEASHLGDGELHMPLMHCRNEFPTVTKPLLHVNMAILPSEIMNTLPLTGSLNVGHFSISKKQEKITV